MNYKKAYLEQRIISIQLEHQLINTRQQILKNEYDEVMAELTPLQQKESEETPSYQDE